MTETPIIEAQDNVILFPKERIVHPEHTAAGVDKVEQTIEAIREQTLTLRRGQMARLIEAIIPFIFGHLHVMGVKQDDDKIIKAGSFLLEALKALLGYHFGIPHKFHKMIEKTMIPDANGRIQIVGFDDDA